MSTLPTVEQITSLYLYGSTSTPSDLSSESLIRPAGVKTQWTVDVNEYMDIGAGRMAYASAFTFIQEFFDKGKLPASESLAPGRYTKRQILEKFGYIDAATGHGLKDASYSFNQINYVDDIDDLVARTYIWGTTAFSVAEDAVFVVGANGERSVENFAIVPHPKIQEDFDFVGGAISQLGNWALLYDTIDPSRIGRAVNINFSGARTSTTLDYADYASSDYGIQYTVPTSIYGDGKPHGQAVSTGHHEIPDRQSPGGLRVRSRREH